MPVHIRINDESNQPTPVRLRISDEKGYSYPPFGYPQYFPTGMSESVGPFSRIAKENWFSVSGSFEIDLPTNILLRLQAIKGPLHTPLDESFTLLPGKMAARFTIRKWSASTWRSIDSRVHFERPHDLLLDATAEDVNVVNLLIREQPAFSQDGHLYPIAENLAAFSGQMPLLSAENRELVVNTWNVHPSLGRLGLLHSHRPVYPLNFGEHNDDWSLCDWCDQCHRKQGLTVWSDPFQPDGGLLGGEPLIAAILGKIDAFELDARPRTQPLLPWYYRLLNAGFRLPLIGGSARDANTIPVGALRTFVPSEDSWVHAMKNGRSFVTNGPMLTFDVNDGVANATAESVSPFDELQIVHNGSVIATSHAVKNESTNRYTAFLDNVTNWPESGWLAARCVGNHPSLLYAPVLTFAHSSPIAVDVPCKPFSHRRASLPLLRKCVDDTQRWIEERGRFTSDKPKKHLLDLCAQALLKLAE